MFGCSSKDTTTAQVTPTPNQQNSEVDPLLSKKGFDGNMMILTDPVLYSYIQGKQTSATSTTTTIDPTIQKKIGTLAQFAKISKYGLSGRAEIVGAQLIRITEFNYNGGCGALTTKLTLLSANNDAIATVEPTISTPQSNTSFDITIPNNITLIQFDAISLYCQNQQEPVSSVELK